LLRKDGTDFPGEINAKVVVFADEPQIQVWVRDLTEQKLLEKRVVEGQKMEAVGILAGGIAHDFNNLLQIISGHAELLEIQLTKRGLNFDEMTAILRASDRGAELVKQILTFSRRVNTEFASVNLNEDVRATERLLSRTIPKMIEIELRLEEELLPVRADSTQIQQLLINLAVNAKDAMPEGGTITIETRNIGADEEYCAQHGLAPGPCVLLRVSDTGHGMEQEVLEHIYEPFFTTKGLAQGTGLGLAAVFGIVKMHGGHITCESEVGKGTTFEISFPTAEVDTPSPVPVQEKLEAEGGTETILVVDDEELIQELAKRILEKSGYRVFTAGSGTEAIEIYAEHTSEISLIILDLIMPEMGGKQCLNELLKIDPRVKALVSTGFAIEGEAKEFFDAKAKGEVSKPFNGGELRRTVRRIIDST
jgi:signal transduction histidine kinase/ActR/RegA family two-component response regulator